MLVLTVIPARGGSKRLPNKNIREFAGKPLIHWTIKAAMEAGIEQAIVSTESPLIATACLEHLEHRDSIGLCKRPRELAEDDTPTIKVLQHALQWADKSGHVAEWVMCLQPTSPLRSSNDIHAAMSACCPHCKDSVITVTATAPLGSVGGATFKTNGAIYLIHRETLLRGSLYGDEPILHYMPPERSIDIDTLEDFERAEAIWKSGLASRSFDKVVGHT